MAAVLGNMSSLIVSTTTPLISTTIGEIASPNYPNGASRRFHPILADQPVYEYSDEGLATATVSSMGAVFDNFSLVPNTTNGSAATFPPYSSRDLWAQNELFARNMIPVMVFIGLLMMIGIPGNCLVVYVYGMRFKSATQNVLIVYLACLDLVMCVLAMPSEIMDVRFHHTFHNELLCKFLRSTTMVVSIASCLTLMSVAYDRHKRITQPLSRQMTPRAAKVWAGLDFLGAVFMSWPTFIMTGLKSSETDIPGLYGQDCSFSQEFVDTSYPLVFNCFLALGFFTAIAVLSFLYFRIWRAARSRKINMAKRYTITSTSESSNELKGCDANGGNTQGDILRQLRRQPSLDNTAFMIRHPGGLSLVWEPFMDIVSESGTSCTNLSMTSSLPGHRRSCVESDVTEITDFKGSSENKSGLPVRKTKSLFVCSDNGEINAEGSVSQRQGNKTCGNPISYTDSLVPGRCDNSEKCEDNQTPKENDVLSPVSVFLPNSKDGFSDVFDNNATDDRHNHSSGEGPILCHDIQSENGQVGDSYPSCHSCDPVTSRDKDDGVTTLSNSPCVPEIEVSVGDLTNPLPSRSLCRDYFEDEITPEENDEEGKVSSSDYVELDVRTLSDNLPKDDIPSYEDHLSSHIVTSRPTHRFYRDCDNSTKTCYDEPCITSICQQEIDITNKSSNEEVATDGFPDDRDTGEESKNDGDRTLQCEHNSDTASESHGDFSGDDSDRRISMDLSMESFLQLFGPLSKPIELPLGVDSQGGEDDVFTTTSVISLAKTNSTTEEAPRIALDLVHNGASYRNSNGACSFGQRDSIPPCSLAPGECRHSETKSHRRNGVSRVRINSDPEDISMTHLESRFPGDDSGIPPKEGDQISSQNQSNAAHHLEPGSPLSVSRRTRRWFFASLDKTTVVALAVSCVFLLSFLPYLIVMSIRGLIKGYYESLDWTSLCVYQIFVRFYFLNSASNPILYGLFNPNFRRECRNTWRRLVQGHSRSMAKGRHSFPRT